MSLIVLANIRSVDSYRYTMGKTEMHKHSLLFLLFFVLISHEVEGDAWFTKVPGNLYVVKGQTARFVWDYQVNIGTHFKDFFPRWLFKGEGLNSSIIGYDRKNNDGSSRFEISFKTCPPRLLTRASKLSTATLVITDVTTAENGEYECVVLLTRDSNYIFKSKSQLIVTETPAFTFKPNPTTTGVEHTNVSINCTAVGPPSPNVTWLNAANNHSVIQGTGSAVYKISSIKRDKNGTKFKCLATNNPNQSPITAETTVIVYYAPEIKSTFVKRTYCIWDKANITVSVDGNPKPSITCKHGQLDRKVQFIIENDDQYGNYTCKVTNSVGSVTYVVQLIKTNTSCQPTKPTPAPSTDSVHPGIIAGAVLAAILLIVGVVIAIIFWRRRKTYKRDSTTSHKQTVHMNDLDDGEEQYATAQHANRAPAPKEEPTVQYAVVDKSKKKKKKQPGELIYADLDHEATTQSDRPPSDRRPTGSSDQDTVYADINRAQEETPRYGNLQQTDHM